MIDVCLLGCGGMMPLPERYLTSLYVRYEGHALLIDCGEGTQVAIRAAELGFKAIDTICLTHFHADHVSGLPGLLLTIGNSGRTDPLRIIGPTHVADVVRVLRFLAPVLPFEVFCEEIPAKGKTFPWWDCRLTAFPVEHKVPCYGFTIDLARPGRFDPDRARAAGIPLQYWKFLQKGETVREGRKKWVPEDVLGAPRKGLRLTYCTDTRPLLSIAENALGADLAILEGMYGDPEKDEDAQEKEHMTIREATELARAACVKELWLTHYSPSLDHPEEYLESACEIFPNTRLGENGKHVTLRFEE